MGKTKIELPALPVSADRVYGVVKFFNPTEGSGKGQKGGFGFIAPEGGQYADVFIHIAAIEASGLAGLVKDQRVSFVVTQDPRNADRRCATSIELEKKAAPATITGTVKWFNADKGYGFIAPEGGGKDVFLHASAVEKAKLELPIDGKQVTFIVVAGRNGRTQAEKLALV